MATSLFKMPFDPERLKVQRIYAEPGTVPLHRWRP